MDAGGRREGGRRGGKCKLTKITFPPFSRTIVPMKFLLGGGRGKKKRAFGDKRLRPLWRRREKWKKKRSRRLRRKRRKMRARSSAYYLHSATALPTDYAAVDTE